MSIIAEQIKVNNTRIGKELLNSLKLSICRSENVTYDKIAKNNRDCKGQVIFSAPRFVPSANSSFRQVEERRTILDYRITSGKSSNSNICPQFLKTGSGLIGGYHKTEKVGLLPVFFKGYRYTEFSTEITKKTDLVRTSVLFYPWQDGERIIEHTIYKTPRLRNPETFKRAERKPVKKTIQNLTRAKKRCRNLVLSNYTKNTEMWTLTYKENKLSLKEAKKDLNLFIKHCNYRRKKKGLENLQYIWVAERQQRGAIHFHIMVFNPEIENTSHLTKWEEERRGSEMLSHWWKKGWSYQTKHIKNKLYICKYITKSSDFLEDVNERIFSASLNLSHTKPCIMPGIFQINWAGKAIYTKENYFNTYAMYLEKKKKVMKC